MSFNTFKYYVCLNNCHGVGPVSGRCRAGVGLAGVGLAGVGLAGVGLAGIGLAGVGLAGVGLAGVGLAGVGLAGVGLAGRLDAWQRCLADHRTQCTERPNSMRYRRKALLSPPRVDCSG